MLLIPSINRGITSLMQEDLRNPSTFTQNILWIILHKFAEPLLNLWPLTKLREKALSNLMEHIHYEDETSQYICLSLMNKVSNNPCVTDKLHLLLNNRGST